MGSPSAIDAIAFSRSSVRHVAMMQVTGDNAFVPPPSLQNGQPPNNLGLPPGARPQNAAPLPPPSGGFLFPQPSSSLPAPLSSTVVTPIGPSSPAANTLSPLNSGGAGLPGSTSPGALPQPLSQNLPINPSVGNGRSASPAAPPVGGYVPQLQQPRGTGVPNSFAQPIRPSANDYASIAPPQLDNAFATMGNCRNISGPSTYSAAGIFGCNPPPNNYAPVYGPPTYGTPATYVAPPSQIAPPIAVPPGVGVAPASYTGTLPAVLPGNPGYRPLFSFGQEKKPVQIGQGLVGQPVAYVPGQCFRNALRYISF